MIYQLNSKALLIGFLFTTVIRGCPTDVHALDPEREAVGQIPPEEASRKVGKAESEEPSLPGLGAVGFGAIVKGSNASALSLFEKSVGGSERSSAAEPNKAPEKEPENLVNRFASGILWAVLLACAAVGVLSKFRKRPFSFKQGLISVLDTTSLGNRGDLHLVSVRGREFLISASIDGIRTLAEVGEGDALHHLEQLLQSGDAGAQSFDSGEYRSRSAG